MSLEVETAIKLSQSIERTPASIFALERRGQQVRNWCMNMILNI
jgi:hypothetical protein